MTASDIILFMALAVAVGATVLARRAVQRERARSSARVAALAAAIEADAAIAERDEPGAMRVGSLFEPGQRDRRQPRLAAAIAVAMAIGVATMLATQRGTTTAARPPVDTITAAEPLELMSLAHRREGGAFIVTGLVRNPRAANPVTGLTAVVSAYDRDGVLVARSSAAIDFTTLEPGDGSPFAVRVGTPGPVGRYRVAFERGGSIIRHVDRRAAPVSMASSSR